MNRTPKTCLALGIAALSALFAPPARADSPALDRAKNAILRGDFATAEKEIASVKGGPERADALLMKAGLELETGRYADAVATARSAAGLGKATKIDAKPLEAEALARAGQDRRGDRRAEGGGRRGQGLPRQRGARGALASAPAGATRRARRC